MRNAPLPKLALAALLAVLANGRGFALGADGLTADEVPELRLNHYFTPDNRPHDPEFDWTFTKTGFTIKRGEGAIPENLARALLPEGVVADEIRGKWAINAERGTLDLTEIKAGKATGKAGVKLRVMMTGGTVVRLCVPEQFVFGIGP
jgi:hypothetical protein